MADWLKVRLALVRSAKVRELMRQLRCKRHAALGLMLEWLVWVDEQTTDGETRLLPRELDEELGCKGATAALISIGWCALDASGYVCAVEFGKHCGASAKTRAENAVRQARFKAGNGKGNAKSVTEVTPDALPEKNRIEKNKQSYIQGEAYSNAVSDSDGAREPRPKSADEVLRFMSAQPNCALPPQQLAACAESYWGESEAVGWMLKGQPVRDWRATARVYLAKWQLNVHRAGQRGEGGNVRQGCNNRNDYR